MEQHLTSGVLVFVWDWMLDWLGRTIHRGVREKHKKHSQQLDTLWELEFCICYMFISMIFRPNRVINAPPTPCFSSIHTLRHLSPHVSSLVPPLRHLRAGTSARTPVVAATHAQPLFRRQLEFAVELGAWFLAVDGSCRSRRARIPHRC